jgi:flagellar basal-body rod protein FlgG
MRSLSIGATGMLAQQTNVEVISNNIANLSTTGFKKQRAEFQDLLYQNMRQVGSTSSDTGTVVPSGIQIGAGVRMAAVYRINEQGDIKITGNPLDLAINGKGFLQVQMPDSTTAYTRAGSLQMNASGTLVTQDGYTVLPEITIPSDATEITVNSSGQVIVKLDGQTATTTAGQLQIATFPNPTGLEAIGNNLLRETPASGTAAVGTPESTGYGKIQQNALETSNVNIVEEVTSLISAQRAYEMNSKTIKTSDDMLSTISQLR